MSELGRPRVLGRLWATNEAKLSITIVLVIALTALVDSNHTYWNDPAESASRLSAMRRCSVSTLSEARWSSFPAELTSPPVQ